MSQDRVQKGVPSGGQFAASRRGEADAVSLESAVSPATADAPLSTFGWGTTTASQLRRGDLVRHTDWQGRDLKVRIERVLEGDGEVLFTDDPHAVAHGDYYSVPWDAEVERLVPAHENAPTLVTPAPPGEEEQHWSAVDGDDRWPGQVAAYVAERGEFRLRVTPGDHSSYAAGGFHWTAQNPNGNWSFSGQAATTEEAGREAVDAADYVLSGQAEADHTYEDEGFFEH